jgi:hypothetical protein
LTTATFALLASSASVNSRPVSSGTPDRTEMTRPTALRLDVAFVLFSSALNPSTLTVLFQLFPAMSGPLSTSPLTRQEARPALSSIRVNSARVRTES